MPTPVGPKNRNEPIGLFGSFSPTLPLLIALLTASTASFWPITLLCNVSSRCFSLSFSSCVILFTGILVQLAITSAISSSFKFSTFLLFLLCHFFFSFSNLSFCSFSLSLKVAAFSKSWTRIASSFSLSNVTIFSSISFMLSGIVYVLIFILEAASSIKSMALSGKNLSLMYLVDNSTAAFIAPSEIFTLWWASYLSLKPSNILIVSSSVGSPTVTGLNLLSNALSFSIYFLYSFKVVAPTTWTSPLAKSGFSIFAASTAPSAEPAPTIVWISSIKRITSPAFLTSDKHFFILSSKSPLYLAPATIPEISRVTTLLFFSISGTSSTTIFSANPSTTAVFPTPGSPIKQGLFFVLLDKIWITLSISLFLPITGSSLPSLACFVRSEPNWFNVGVELKLPEFLSKLFLGELESTPSSSITFIISLYSFLGSIFKSIIILTATLSPSRIIPIKICSVPINSEPNFLASINAFSITLLLLGVNPIDSPCVNGSPVPISISISCKISSTVTFWFSITLLATPVPSFAKP